MKKCKHCDHFVDENLIPDEDILERHSATIAVKGFDLPLARYVHLDDGNQEYDHDPEPGEDRNDWATHRPDLFTLHPDGAIGPNSRYHSQVGKVNNEPWARTEPSEKEGMVQLILGDKMVGYIFTEDAEHLCEALNQWKEAPQFLSNPTTQD